LGSQGQSIFLFIQGDDSLMVVDKVEVISLSMEMLVSKCPCVEDVFPYQFCINIITCSPVLAKLGCVASMVLAQAHDICLWYTDPNLGMIVGVQVEKPVARHHEGYQGMVCHCILP